MTHVAFVLSFINNYHFYIVLEIDIFDIKITTVFCNLKPADPA